MNLLKFNYPNCAHSLYINSAENLKETMTILKWVQFFVLVSTLSV